MIINGFTRQLNNARCQRHVHMSHARPAVPCPGNIRQARLGFRGLARYRVSRLAPFIARYRVPRLAPLVQLPQHARVLDLLVKPPVVHGSTTHEKWLYWTYLNKGCNGRIWTRLGTKLTINGFTRRLKRRFVPASRPNESFAFGSTLPQQRKTGPSRVSRVCKMPCTTTCSLYPASAARASV